MALLERRTVEWLASTLRSHGAGVLKADHTTDDQRHKFGVETLSGRSLVVCVTRERSARRVLWSLGSCLGLKYCESLFTRVPTSMERTDNADAREQDDED